MNIIFMGSPDFAVDSLEKLHFSEKINIEAVISQPDRKKGRGQKKKATPVKKKASELGIEVLTSTNVNQKSFIEKIKKYSPDAIVVVAFGQKFSRDLLELPEYGCINLHASLLPKYRGSSPIHQSIINGDNKTGVTTMYMDEKLDNGDIIYKKEIKIEYKDTVGKLHDKLASEGAELLLKTMIDIEKGIAPRKEQNDKKATYAPKIDKSLGKINWNDKTEKIYNLVRGVNPWPGAYTYYEGEKIKIWKVSIVNNDFDKGEIGEIIKSDVDNGIIVRTADGYLKIDKLQPAGKRKMNVEDYLRGNVIAKGEKFA